MHPTSTRRKVGATLVAGVLSALALFSGAGPASAAPPSAPVTLTPVVSSHTVNLYWTAPNDSGGKPVSLYDIERIKAGKVDASWQIFASAGPTFVDGGATDGTTYTYKVRARNADGPGPWWPTPPVTPKATTKAWAPFPTAAAMVSYWTTTLLHRTPTAAEYAAAVEIQAGTLTPAAFIDDLAHAKSRIQNRHPVVRFYWGYFNRAPDQGGLAYWQHALDTKAKSLVSVAQFFQKSAEYKETYGATTDKQFVKLLYANVYHRPSELAGIAYWTNELATHHRTRGEVMIQFSELQEGRTRLKGRTEASEIYMAIMGDDSFGSFWAAPMSYGHIDAGGTQGEIALFLRTTQV